jgi:hypothetical protein
MLVRHPQEIAHVEMIKIDAGDAPFHNRIWKITQVSQSENK